MIRLYSGTPGSGKSLHNAQDVINRSRFGRPVIGNFPCDLSKYKKARYTYVPNHQITPKFLIEYSQAYFAGNTIKEGAILLVLDECQLLFNARDWQQKGRDAWLSFFTQHRHYGYDITLIAQFDRMIDRQIRSLIEYEYLHRKMANIGFMGKVLSFVLGGKTFIAVEMWYPLKLKTGSELFHARKSLYSIYDSYAIFDVKPSAKETHPQVKTAEKPPEGDMQQLHEDPIHDAAQPEKQSKRRFFRKLSFQCRQPREKKPWEKKVKKKYLPHYRNPWPLPFWAKLRRLFYRGKFNRQFPENRTETGWQTHKITQG